VDSVKWSPAVLCCTVSVPDYKGNPPLEPAKISTSPAAHSPLRALLSHYRSVPQYDTIGRVRIAPPKRLFHLGPDHSASTETRVDSPHSWPLLPRILFPFPVAPAQIPIPVNFVPFSWSRTTSRDSSVEDPRQLLLRPSCHLHLHPHPHPFLQAQFYIHT